MLVTPLMAYVLLAFTLDWLHDSEFAQLLRHAGASPSPAAYGKHASETMPESWRYCHALGNRPPEHPLSPVSQLTKSSTDRTGEALLVAMATRSLNTSAAENAQQLPHCSWFRIGWIKPAQCVVASNAAGIESSEMA